MLWSEWRLPLAPYRASMACCVSLYRPQKSASTTLGIGRLTVGGSCGFGKVLRPRAIRAWSEVASGTLNRSGGAPVLHSPGVTSGCGAGSPASTGSGPLGRRRAYQGQESCNHHQRQPPAPHRRCTRHVTEWYARNDQVLPPGRLPVSPAMGLVFRMRALHPLSPAGPGRPRRPRSHGLADGAPPAREDGRRRIGDHHRVRGLGHDPGGAGEPDTEQPYGADRVRGFHRVSPAPPAPRLLVARRGA